MHDRFWILDWLVAAGFVGIDLWLLGWAKHWW